MELLETSQVGTEIRCAGHEIIIPARNRHNGWLEEKLSVAVVQQVNELDDTTALGFIEHSKSPYSSPIVMVKKKTGKWRLCVDFRQINAKSVKDAYQCLA